MIKRVMLLLLFLRVFVATSLDSQLVYKQHVIELFDGLQNLIVSISDGIKASVVHIDVVKKSNDFKYKVLACGLIVDKGGYILTNEHVVDDALSVTVTLLSKLEYPAEIIGTDKQTDLSLIKIETPKTLLVPIMGNSDQVEVGEWVIAVGNPYGFDRTVSSGIVSGKGRVLPNLTLEGQLINPDFANAKSGFKQVHFSRLPKPGGRKGQTRDLERWQGQERQCHLGQTA
jgi:S1-C subfamily serine protease